MAKLTTERGSRDAFTQTELRRLEGLRARYDRTGEYFRAEEVARLWFSRWMWITRRLES